MKYDNNELIEIGNDVLGSIAIALAEVDGVEEFNEVIDALEEAKELATEIRDKYSGIAYEEEMKELNDSYIASVWCE